MATNPLNNVIFQDATKAREWLESLLWANGRSCGYCGTLEASTPLKGREGYYQCKACRKQLTVMVGTVFERSHIPRFRPDRHRDIASGNRMTPH